MIVLAALLASWLATQQWAWDKSPATENVTAYRIYWSTQPTLWCTTSRTEFDAATHCGLAAGCDNDATCCGDVSMPPDDVVFFLVTAVNANGESNTEHGEVQTCP